MDLDASPPMLVRCVKGVANVSGSVPAFAVALWVWICCCCVVVSAAALAVCGFPSTLIKKRETPLEDDSSRA